MSETTKVWVAVVCATLVMTGSASVVLLGSGDLAPPPPAAHGQALEFSRADAVLPVVAYVGTRATANTVAVAENAPAPATPLAETRRGPRAEPEPRQSVLVAVDARAAGALPPDFETSLAARQAELQLSLAPAGDRPALQFVTSQRADMALITGSLTTRERHAGLRQTTIGVELYALAVAADCPLQSLTHDQMQQVLTGELGSWQQLGLDRGAITLVVPANATVADRAAGVMIPGLRFADSAMRLANGQQAAAHLQHHPGAIAVARVTGTLAPGLRLLQIERRAPTAAAFRSGSYPYGTPMQLVTPGLPDGSARQLLDLICSPDGRTLLAQTLVSP